MKLLSCQYKYIDSKDEIAVEVEYKGKRYAGVIYEC